MALYLLTGPAASGKTAQAHSRIREVVRSGGRALVLVPAAPDVTVAYESLSPDAPLGVSVQSIDAFLDGQWRLRGDGRRIVSPSQRILLLADIASSHVQEVVDSDPAHRGTLVILSRLARHVGGLPEGADVEFRDSDTIAGGLLRAVYEYGCLLKAAELIERVEAHRLVADSLQVGDLPELVVLDGLSDLTAEQERFVLRAAGFTDLVVCLTYDPEVPATAASEALVRRLRDGGEEARLRPAPDAAPLAEIAALRRLGANKAGGPLDARGAIVISQAWGADAEAARIVREVQDALAEGTPAGRVAVVFRDPAAFLDPLTAALREASIDAEWDAEISFVRSGLGRALLSALRFDDEHHSGRLDLLRTPYSPASDALLDSIDAQVRGGLSVHARRFEAMCFERDAEAGSFLRDVRKAREAIGREDGRLRWHRIIAGMLGRAWPSERSRDPGFLADASAARAFMEAIEGAFKLGLARVRSADIAAALRETRIALSSGSGWSRVQVMGADRARGRRFDCVILGGLTATSFPGPVREDALSAPGIVVGLRAAGVDVIRRGGLEEERLLFYQVITRATRRLVLSTQSHDADGRELPGSLFIDEVLDLYRERGNADAMSAGPPVRTLKAGEVACHIDGPFTRRRQRRAVAQSSAYGKWRYEGGDPHEGAPDRRLADDPEVLSAARRARRSSPALGPESIAALGDQKVFSATDIETYLQCPYRWYIERVIRPQEIDERFDASVVGRFVHDVMYRFYMELAKRAGARRVTADLLPEARGIHAEVARAAAERIHAQRVEDVLALRTGVDDTGRLIEQDATFLPGMTPVRHEWSFGIDDEPEPVGDFLLAGRIDRIDADEREAVVIDYKRSAQAATRSHARFAEQGLVQLPLYALVASRRLSLEIGGGLYRPVRPGKPRGFISVDRMGPEFTRGDDADRETIAALVADAVERSQSAVNGMREGRIAPEPRGGRCPGHCSALAFCPERRPCHGRP